MAGCPILMTATAGDATVDVVACREAACQLWDADAGACGLMASAKLTALQESFDAALGEDGYVPAAVEALQGAIDGEGGLTEKLGDLGDAVSGTGGLTEKVGDLEEAVSGETGLTAKVDAIGDALTAETTGLNAIMSAIGVDIGTIATELGTP